MDKTTLPGVAYDRHVQRADGQSHRTLYGTTPQIFS